MSYLSPHNDGTKAFPNNFFLELNRLATFLSYPRHTKCSPILLARQGFVCINDAKPSDYILKCVFCCTEISVEKTGDVETCHRMLKPDCPMVKGHTCGNKLITNYERDCFDDIFSQLDQWNKNDGDYTMEMVKKQNKEQDPTMKINNHPEASVTSTSTSGRTTNQICSNSSWNNTEQSYINSLPNNILQSQGNAFASASMSHSHVSSDTCLPDTEGSVASQFVTNHASSMFFPWQSQGDSCDSEGAEVNQIINNVQPDGARMSTPSRSSASNMAPAHTLADGGSGTVTSNNDIYSESQTSQNHYQTPSNSVAPQQRNMNNTATTSEVLPNEPLPSSTEPSASISTSDIPPSQSQSGERQTNYENFGIITARPKRPEYAVETTRLQSFQKWSSDHHIKPEELVKAGYFYVGYSDCVRCFFCAIGLRNWMEGDDVWVEHARWSPKCGFVQQTLGKVFVNVVKDLDQQQEMISYQDVITEMRAQGLSNVIPEGIKDDTSSVENDPAVKIIIEYGFSKDDVIKAARSVKETGQMLAADLIYDELLKQRAPLRTKDSRTIDNHSKSTDKKRNSEKDQETINALKNKNIELRHVTMCKVCLDKEVSVLFLPCSHYVSCNDCSFALESCPLCRKKISGVVRSHMS